MKMFSKLPSMNITDQSVIKLHTISKSFHVLHCGDTPAADMAVQPLSNIDVADESS